MKTNETREAVPISAIVPTCDRSKVLARTLGSLANQGLWPAELIIVDASEDASTRSIVQKFGSRAPSSVSVEWIPAGNRGAAAQRNKGVSVSSQPYIWFIDDDIVFEPECLARLWKAINSKPDIAGANAMITNQRFVTPGAATRAVLRVIAGCSGPYAGRVLGPVINFLPEDRDGLPSVVDMEWLNTTCTLYRRDALPQPVFGSHFSGYSMYEDVTLSASIARNWRLVNARTARIFHDTQPGSHKSDPGELAEMALFNRHHVMAEVFGHTRIIEYIKLAVWLVFCHVASLRSVDGRRTLFRRIRGEWRAVQRIRSISL